MIERSQIERLEQRLQSGELPPDFALKREIVTRYAENHGGLLMTSSAVAAVIGFSVIGTMGGVGIALIAAQYLLKWNSDRRKDWEAIESGKYAHLLTAKEQKEYQRIYGGESYQAALKGDYTHAGLAPKDAIDVPAQRVDEPAKKPEATAPSAAAPQDSRTPTPSLPSPVPYLIGDRLRTALIVSVSGGGKDILLSNAVRVFLSHCPAFRVIVADCKDDPKEYAYYDNLPNVSVHRLNVAIASDGEVIKWVDNWVSEFIQLPEQALLICNEGTLIRAKSKRYVQAIDGLVSSGDSRQKYCWEAGQSAHTDDLQINGAARSRFRMLIIGLKGEEMQIEAVLSAKFVADSARNMNDIRAQMLRSPVSRAWSDGQQWFAMPALENYSGYDRDSRSMLQTAMPQPSTEDAKADLERLYQDGAIESSTDGTEPLEKLSRYLQNKGKIDLRTLDKNWGRNNDFQGEALKDLLTQLEVRGSIVTWGDGIIWKG